MHVDDLLPKWPNKLHVFYSFTVSLEASTSRNGGGYFFMKGNILPGWILMDNLAPGYILWHKGHYF